MRRRLFLSALSLLLFIAVCGMWARSYWRADVVGCNTGPATCGIAANRGVILLMWLPNDYNRPGISWLHDVRDADGSWEGNLSLGFGVSREGPNRFLFLPHAAAAAVTGVVAVGAWLSHRRRRRLARAGCCAECGYDLRATPNRCPECGRSAAA